MKNKIKYNKKLIACVKALVDDDAWITIQETAEAVDISSGGVSNIFKDELHYSKVSARCVPHILTQVQENKRGRIGYSKSLPQI